MTESVHKYHIFVRSVSLIPAGTLGSLRATTPTATKTSHNSEYILIISTRLLCQMQANSPGPSRVSNNHVLVQIEKENFVVACLSPPRHGSLPGDFCLPFFLGYRTILSLGILRTSPGLLAFPVLYTSTLQIERGHSNKAKKYPK